MIRRCGIWLGTSVALVALLATVPAAAWARAVNTPKQRRATATAAQASSVPCLSFRPECNWDATQIWAALHGVRNPGALRQPPPPGVSRESGSPTRSVPKATCGPDDRPETGLQGQVPWPDRVSGRAAEGYSCNLRLIARYPDHGFANLDSYK